jgi:tetratricopeptide (TPR) repeat protein
VQHGLSGNDPVRIGDQDGQDRTLIRGEPDHLASLQDLLAVEIDHQVLELQPAMDAHRGRGFQGRGPAGDPLGMPGEPIEALLSIHSLAEQAERLIRRSLAIAERAPGADDPGVALVLNDLGALHIRQGRYRDAELALTRLLAIQERRLGPEHPDLSYALNNLGGLAQMAGRCEEAGALFARPLALRRRALGPEHPSVASVLMNTGSLALDLGREREAVDLLLDAERIFLLSFSSDHPSIAISRFHRATAHHRLGDLDAANELLRCATSTWVGTAGEEHPRVAQCLSSLARLRDDQCRYEEAGELSA